MKTRIKLDDAISHIYSIITSHDRGVHVFSSNTLQSLSEVVESIQTREENEDDATETKGLYELEYSAVPIGEAYRRYVEFIFTLQSLNINQKVFYVYLYPMYLEAIINAGFAVYETDGAEALADLVHTVLDIGNNQYSNVYALRNGKETLQEQNDFLLKEIETAIKISSKHISWLEDFNFHKLESEFLGWMDNFPTRIINYVLNLHNYDKVVESDEYREIENKIQSDLICIVSELSIFTLYLRRV